jgi:hypothetical protein
MFCFHCISWVLTIINFLRNYFLRNMNYAAVKQSPDEGRSAESQNAYRSVSRIVDVDLMERWVQSLGYNKK